MEMKVKVKMKVKDQGTPVNRQPPLLTPTIKEHYSTSLPGAIGVEWRPRRMNYSQSPI